MAVRIVCGACNTVMQVADELRGKKIKCKSCGGVVPVQEAVAAPRVSAPRAKREEGEASAPRSSAPRAKPVAEEHPQAQ